MGDDCRRGQLGGENTGAGGRLPRRGQLGRVGVEAEADLTAALLDERRKSIGERGQGISRP
ncbi:MAG TPA: hypothetical protein VFX85_07145 [Solirubrobacterales bacterium]|nr:hypothetical protein [Solirubrobacterales bacterium]